MAYQQRQLLTPIKRPHGSIALREKVLLVVDARQ
jgi:hypothetical protein